MGEIAVTLKASSFFYDEETDCYRVKFSESELISHDTSKKTIVLAIPSNKVQTNSQTQQLKDEDIDSILDEIAAKEVYKKQSNQDDKSKRSHSHQTSNKSQLTKPSKDENKETIESSPAPSSEKVKLAQKLASI